MGKKNKNKKTSQQQGSGQGLQQRPAQSNGAGPSAQQAPQTQSAWTTVTGRNTSAQQQPQQRTARPNEAAQNAPAQQASQTQSAWTTVAGRNAPAQQAPQQTTAWSNVAGRNSRSQQPSVQEATPPQRSAWSNRAPQSAAPAQQAPQQRTAWSSVAGRNAPAQQPSVQQATPPQRSAWSNGAPQSAAPAQQAPQQRTAWSNVAGRNSPARQPPQQRWPIVTGENVTTQQPPQQRSAWPHAAGQIAPVQEALAQLSLVQQPPAEQAPVQQPAAEQATGEEAAGGDAAAQKEPRRRRRNMEDEIMTRPDTCLTKHGKLGRQVLLESNYFEVLKRADWCLYQYRVDFAPDEERTFVKKALLRVHAQVLGSYLFDGTMLFCSNRLRSDYMELQSMTDDRRPIKITIKLTGDLARGDHHYLQLFSILVRKCLEYLGLQLVGRNYFDAAARSEIREYDLELWPGYLTSIRQHDRGILMCAEVSHKVMRIKTLYAVLDDIIKECHRSREDYKKKYENLVLGTIVLTTYNNRTYRIDEVDWNANPQTTFERNGEHIHLADYYKSKYQINIQDRQQPLLVSRATKRQLRSGGNELLYLIPELCRSTGLTDVMRINHKLMKALAAHTKLSPETRITKLMDFNKRLLSKPTVVSEFNQWDFQLNNQLVQVKGRVLPGPAIITGNSMLKNTFDWNAMMQQKRFYKTLKLNDWAVIIPRYTGAEAETFITKIIESARKMSFEIKEPESIRLTDDRPYDYVQAIENLTGKSNLQLIMCIVTNNNATKYSAIKKKVCVDRPLPNQVVLKRTLTQRSPNMLGAVTSKIALQMGCKIGCVPWTVNIADVSNLNIMAVGFDVCHDTTKLGSDFGAMVASIDPSHGIYYSSVSAHPMGEELSNSLAFQLECACMAYRKRNGWLPDAIVIYRDGVGEGQVPHVYNYEVKRIGSTLNSVYKGTNKELKLAFIIVTKRINTRLFKERRNPDPGTVVDDVITDPLKYDFFLVSQSAREGTVSPTSYNVIFDSIRLTPDQMQQLSYMLCHMYYNFTGPVRVPAPCQFAHKLAFFVSQSVKQTPNPSLNQLLYFI